MKLDFRSIEAYQKSKLSFAKEVQKMVAEDFDYLYPEMRDQFEFLVKEGKPEDFLKMMEAMFILKPEMSAVPGNIYRIELYDKSDLENKTIPVLTSDELD